MNAGPGSAGTGNVLPAGAPGLKPKVGLLPLYLKLYDDGMPQARARMEKFYQQVAVGLVMVVMGIAMMTGHLSSFARWLLQTFPGFATLG